MKNKEQWVKKNNGPKWQFCQTFIPHTPPSSETLGNNARAAQRNQFNPSIDKQLYLKLIPRNFKGLAPATAQRGTCPTGVLRMPPLGSLHPRSLADVAPPRTHPDLNLAEGQLSWRSGSLKAPGELTSQNPARPWVFVKTNNIPVLSNSSFPPLCPGSQPKSAWKNMQNKNHMLLRQKQYGVFPPLSFFLQIHPSTSETPLRKTIKEPVECSFKTRVNKHFEGNSTLFIMCLFVF